MIKAFGVLRYNRKNHTIEKTAWYSTLLPACQQEYYVFQTNFLSADHIPNVWGSVLVDIGLYESYPNRGSEETVRSRDQLKVQACCDQLKA